LKTRITLALICVSLLACGARAQSKPAGQTSVASAKSETSPALEEAARLNSEVLKLFREGKFDEALPLGKRVLELREKTETPDSMPLAYALANLGAIYTQKGKGGDAEPLLRRALTIVEKKGATESDFGADLYTQLGLLRTWDKDYKSAGPLLLSALSVRSKLHGPDDTSVVPALFGLTDLSFLRGDSEQARSYLSRAISILNRLPPKKDVSTAKRLKSYFCPLSATGSGPEGDKDLSSALWRVVWKLQEPEGDAEREETRKKVVAGGVLNGHVLSKPRPEYPSAAKSQRASGTVVVYIIVDEAGKVMKAEAVCGHPALTKASEDAARQARFTPTLLEGQPVKVSGVITYNFVLQ
jgi:TonB family protein